MNTKTLLSGIKPTGEIHLGNYFGAIKQLVDLLNTGEYEGYVFIADYHALNFVQDAEEMRRLTHELALTYIACGLDPEKVALFKQSAVSAHTELAWIFDTITTMPYLMRAHAFKAAVDKEYLRRNPDIFNNLRTDSGYESFDDQNNRVYSKIMVGTFNYPMLMAADILLYDAQVVPVGQDQKQHIEYTRDTAEKFNRIFGDTFTLPEAYILPDVAIVPGTDGQKMSKSYGNTIPLFASRDEIEKKVMSIVTGSGSERPEHVYAIHRLIKSEEELAPLYKENAGKYKALKDALVDDLDAFISPMRAKYLELKKNPEIVERALMRGEELARAKAEEKIAEVRKVIGVR